MKLTITHQEKYSRGQLILRTLFGWLYIGIPHFFLLFFVGIWSAILSFITFWIVLFTGQVPRKHLQFPGRLTNWTLRLRPCWATWSTAIPRFFPRASATGEARCSPARRVSRGLVILRLLFGFIYVGSPTASASSSALSPRACSASLPGLPSSSPASIPRRWHAFNVGTYRWSTRVSLYLGYFTDEYPKFTGKEY